MNGALLVPGEDMHDQLVLRVAARYQRTLTARGWEGKLVSKEWRLQWSDAIWKLEELPAKGKKKLRVAEMQNPYHLQAGDGFIPANILRVAKVSSSDSFEHVKEKIQNAMLAAAKATLAKIPPEKAKHYDWLLRQQWYENQVYFLEIMPEGVEPFTAHGKDFTVAVEWGSYKAYSPDSDFQQSDPHYTLYESSSAGAARKMYQTLKANPDALKSVAWAKFDEWLKANKIGYEIHFSQWR
jgi:hypothetical protein